LKRQKDRCPTGGSKHRLVCLFFARKAKTRKKERKKKRALTKKWGQKWQCFDDKLIFGQLV
jgi:hypothetical protein